MFSLYAAIVKNLRGVVVFTRYNGEIEEKIKWLKKRFQYRDLGLPPTLYRNYHEKIIEYLEGKPFRQLVYPHEKYLELTNLFHELTSLKYEVVEALIFSSLYISPLLVLDKNITNSIVEQADKIIYTDEKLDIKNWKLHLRIADYTILDMYSVNVIEGMKALECLKENNIECISEILTKRKEFIEKDTKRYWRIKTSKGKPFLAYIDLLRLLIKNYNVELHREIDKDYVAGLTIIPAIFLFDLG